MSGQADSSAATIKDVELAQLLHQAHQTQFQKVSEEDRCIKRYKEFDQVTSRFGAHSGAARAACGVDESRWSTKAIIGAIGPCCGFAPAGIPRGLALVDILESVQNENVPTTGDHLPSSPARFSFRTQEFRSGTRPIRHPRCYQQQLRLGH